MKPSGRFAEGERNRQAIITYFVNNPGSTVPELIQYLIPKDKRMTDIDKQQFRATISGRVKKMTYMGEIKREKFNYPMVNCHGDNIKVATYKCWALVEKTRSIEEVYAALSENVRRMDAAKGEKREAKPKKKVEPWRYVHESTEPIKNQDGQGSGRSRVYVGSTAAMI